MRTDCFRSTPAFFAIFLSVQGVFSFLMTAYAAPGLVGPDLSNNALPLYLCRPISKAEYVLGKMAVLLIPLSMITWVPGAILWAMQAGLEGGGWGSEQPATAEWIVLGLPALDPAAVAALDSRCRRGFGGRSWRALYFSAFSSLPAALSAIVNKVLDTNYGYLLNPGHLIGVIWARMLDVRGDKHILGTFFDVRGAEDVPQWAAWMMMALIFAACVWMLDRKLKGREVVS